MVISDVSSEMEVRRMWDGGILCGSCNAAPAAAAQPQAPAHVPRGATGSAHTTFETWAALQSQARNSAGDGPAAAEGGPGSHIQAEAPLLAMLWTAASVFAPCKTTPWKTLVLKSSANPWSPCIKTRHLKLPGCFCVQTTAFAELPLSHYSVQQVQTMHFPGWL